MKKSLTGSRVPDYSCFTERDMIRMKSFYSDESIHERKVRTAMDNFWSLLKKNYRKPLRPNSVQPSSRNQKHLRKETTTTTVSTRQ